MSGVAVWENLVLVPVQHHTPRVRAVAGLVNRRLRRMAAYRARLAA